MRTIKSERLKKLETELNDLKQWLKLGLVPKNDIEKHKYEISVIEAKIKEEKERLQFLKESGESEDYAAPKRSSSRAYTEMPTGLDMDVGETAGGLSETGFDMEAETTETSMIEEREDHEDEAVAETHDEETDFFSKRRNRWDIVDPDDDNW